MEKFIPYKNLQLSSQINLSHENKKVFDQYIQLVQGRFGVEIEHFLNLNRSHLYLEGLPIEELIQGDTDERAINIFLFALGTMLGEILCYEEHRDGNVVFDIYPRQEDAGEQLGTGTELGWHTDDAHTIDQCDFICLLCLQGDPNALTLVTNDGWFEHVPDETKSALLENAYTISSDKSYKCVTSLRSPIIKLDESEKLELRFDPEFTISDTPDNQTALNSLKQIFSENNTPITLKPGDLLVINNKVAAHARTDFTPDYERKSDRWLKRVIVKRNE